MHRRRVIGDEYGGARRQSFERQRRRRPRRRRRRRQPRHRRRRPRPMQKVCACALTWWCTRGYMIKVCVCVHSMGGAREVHAKGLCVCTHGVVHEVHAKGVCVCAQWVVRERSMRKVCVCSLTGWCTRFMRQVCVRVYSRGGAREVHDKGASNHPAGRALPDRCARVRH